MSGEGGEEKKERERKKRREKSGKLERGCGGKKRDNGRGNGRVKGRHCFPEWAAKRASSS